MKRSLALGLALSGVVVVGVVWWNFSLQPVNSTDSSVSSFVITKGDGVREIANNLADKKLIRNQVAFFLLIKQLGIEKNIQAGSYRLSPNMGASEIALTLTRGTEDQWVTVIEGLRSEEIIESLLKQNVPLGEATLEGEIKAWKLSEGFFFPDTYLVPKETTITGMQELMMKNFNTKFTAQMEEEAKSAGWTKEEVIILASLVEREGRNDAERASIADVLIKRLDSDMSLDVDATLQYALGKQPDGSWWKKDLTSVDKEVDSPFNTYRNAGLPPKPICNPGLSSIKAAIYPTKNPYYFYIHDKDGQIHYARTADEHYQNVAKFL